MEKSERNSNWRHGIRDGFTPSGEVQCEQCFELRRKLEKLREENRRLKAALHYQKKAEEKKGQPGSQKESAHTPSSKKGWKKNADAENVNKHGGAKKGHTGHGRTRISQQGADQAVDINAPEICPECETELRAHGYRERSAYETTQLRVDKIVYRMQRGRCPRCGKVYCGNAPLLPRALYGNSLLAKMLVMHFEHGVTVGRACQVLGDGIQIGGVLGAFHRVARLFKPAVSTLISCYRKAPVRHADETGWRIDGLSGWAWIFCSELVSIFHYCRTRGACIPLAIFGDKPLDGVLIVDRCPAYNRVPCEIQYCYAHLLREVFQLEKEFPDSDEVQTFTAELAPLLKDAMRLQKQNFPYRQFAEKADNIAQDIRNICAKQSRHLGVVDVKRIFLKNHKRLYHWARSPDIPAHNNRAEQEIRRTVIARKTSFGSQSELGAESRSVLQSIVTTAKKNVGTQELELWIRDALNQLAKNRLCNVAAFMPALK